MFFVPIFHPKVSRLQKNIRQFGRRPRLRLEIATLLSRDLRVARFSAFFSIFQGQLSFRRLKFVALISSRGQKELMKIAEKILLGVFFFFLIFTACLRYFGRDKHLSISSP